MARLRKGYFEPTALDLQEERVSTILSRLDQQQQSIASLLQKYSDGTDPELANINKINKPPMHKLPDISKSKAYSRPKSNLLPIIKSKTIQLKRNHDASVGQSARTHKKTELQKAYTASNPVKSRINRGRSQISSAYKQQSLLLKAYDIPQSEVKNRKQSPASIYLLRSSRIHQPSISSVNTPVFKENPYSNAPYISHTIPQPIAIKNEMNLPRQRSVSSSSEEEDIPLMYYQKEYKAMMKSQSLEEINYLYFSKNESMKEWTDGIMGMFEKHDKELVSLRKKCKFLQSFQKEFWISGMLQD